VPRLSRLAQRRGRFLGATQRLVRSSARGNTHADLDPRRTHLPDTHLDDAGNLKKRLRDLLRSLRRHRRRLAHPPQCSALRVRATFAIIACVTRAVLLQLLCSSSVAFASDEAAEVPPEELADVLPNPSDTGILFPARGVVAFALAGGDLVATFKLRTALTPPPGIQQERALHGWEASLSTSSGVRVPGAPPHRYPVRVSRIRPGGPTLTYRFWITLPAWVPPDLYDLEVAGPGFLASRPAAVRVIDPADPRPFATYRCAPDGAVPESAWASLDVEALVLNAQECPHSVLDPLGLPAAAVLALRPGPVARDLFRLAAGPSRWAQRAGNRQVVAADGDDAFLAKIRASARGPGARRELISLPVDSPAGRASLVGASPPVEWDPSAVSAAIDGLTVRLSAPAGVPLKFKVVTDGKAWQVEGPDGPLRPARVATTGPPALEGVPESAVLYFEVSSAGAPVEYRARRRDIRPPAASLWVDGRRVGGAPHAARVGRAVKLEVRLQDPEDGAASVLWDLGAEVGGSARGRRAEIVYRHVGRHPVTVVILGERGTRRTLSVDLDIRPGGGPGCANAGSPANWTASPGLAIILVVALALALAARGNSRGRRERWAGRNR